MQSVVLIGNSSFTLDLIKNIPHHGSIANYTVSNARYVVEYPDGHLYFDFSEQLSTHFDINELKKIPYGSPNFILLTFTSKELLRKVLLKGNLRNIYVDDDHGEIVPVEKFMKTL
ncbi:hypothetical protein [Cohnella abietis]|uniref:Uncharacterized protein n=1 Tax=Cohnella abietis TaxID=2507935 RepID=A0A3T1D6Y9_9BACL|nr:hypothetical protein [Cohnella abietis]BBI33834.1 hypothetical protein KCTCHS21_32330 [Cohnella abietis]